MNHKLINNVFKDKNTPIPIWFLRQSGRHIPEYFKIRDKEKNFINFCLDEKLVIESTKLPFKYYNLDAAIVFSDILMIPWAMNRNVQFLHDIGPCLDPLVPEETKIVKNVKIAEKLDVLQRSILALKKELPKSVSLIGFAGAPWTLACYMIEGKGSKDFINTRKSVWNSNKWFMELIDILTIYVAEKLELQAKSGADVLMLFDSWSHMIPNNFFKDLGITPISKIVKILRSKNIFVPIIGFPFKAGSSIVEYSYESLVDCVALDWTIDLKWAKDNLNQNVVLQGNLDPASLIPDNSSFLQDNVLSILKTMKDKRFIFNVGHGLTPECKIENVRKVINIVRNFER